MYLSDNYNSRYESDYESIYIGINGQTRSVSFNVLSIAYISMHILACLFSVWYSCESKPYSWTYLSIELHFLAGFMKTVYALRQ